MSDTKDKIIQELQTELGDIMTERRKRPDLTKAHLFAFDVLNDNLRNLNHRQYKEVCRWLRVCRNKVEARIDQIKLDRMISDTVYYGVGVYEG